MARRAGIAVLLLCAAAGARAAAAGASVDARMVFGPRYRPGRPFPVEVRARAGSRAAAWVEIADGGHGYRARLALGPGASSGPRRLWAVLGEDPTAARVRLLDADGNALAERELEPAPRPLARNQRLVVVVSERGGRWPRLPAPEGVGVRAAAVRPDELPERACVWEGVDLAVIESLPDGGNPASAARLGALASWFRAGGRVLFANPAAAERAGRDFLYPYLPNASWEELKQAGARDGDVLAWLKEGEPAAFRFRRAFGEGVVLRFDYTALGPGSPTRSRAKRAAVRAFMLMLLEAEPAGDPRVDPALYAAMPDPWESLPRAGAAVRTAAVLLGGLLAALALIWRARRRGRTVLAAAAGFALAGIAFVALVLPRADGAFGVLEMFEGCGKKGPFGLYHKMLPNFEEGRVEVFALLRSGRSGVRAAFTCHWGAPHVVAPSAGRLRAWSYTVDTDMGTILGPEFARGEAALFGSGPVARATGGHDDDKRAQGLPPYAKGLLRWASARTGRAVRCTRTGPPPMFAETMIGCPEALLVYWFSVDLAPKKAPP